MKNKESLKKARKIAEYQFSCKGKKLFPDHCEVKERKSGLIRYVKEQDKELAFLRTNDGLFTLSIEGARKLKKITSSPSNRVIIQKEVQEFIEKGKNVFAKHVIEVDPEIRSRDEVLVVNKNDKLLGNGKATLSAKEIKSFQRGMAIDIRNGIKGG